jgi:hypothetical protein
MTVLIVQIVTIPCVNIGDPVDYHSIWLPFCIVAVDLEFLAQLLGIDTQKFLCNTHFIFHCFTALLSLTKSSIDMSFALGQV